MSDKNLNTSDRNLLYVTVVHFSKYQYSVVKILEITAATIPLKYAYLDIGGVAVLDHVEATVGQMDLEDGPLHQEFLDLEVTLNVLGSVYQIWALFTLPVLYQLPQFTPSSYLEYTRKYIFINHVNVLSVTRKTRRVIWYQHVKWTEGIKFHQTHIHTVCIWCVWHHNGMSYVIAMSSRSWCCSSFPACPVVTSADGVVECTNKLCTTRVSHHPILSCKRVIREWHDYHSSHRRRRSKKSAISTLQIEC